MFNALTVQKKQALDGKEVAGEGGYEEAVASKIQIEWTDPRHC